MVTFKKQNNYNTVNINIVQKDDFSIYLTEDFLDDSNISIDMGFFYYSYSSITNFWLENKYLGKATGYLKNGLCNLNKVTLNKYYPVI